MKNFFKKLSLNNKRASCPIQIKGRYQNIEVIPDLTP